MERKRPGRDAGIDAAAAVSSRTETGRTSEFDRAQPKQPSTKLFFRSRLKLLILAVAGAFVVAAVAPRLTHITSVDGVVDTKLMTVRSEISGIVKVPAAVFPGAVLKLGDLTYEIKNNRYSESDTVSRYYAIKNQLHLVIGECDGLQIELLQLARDRDRTERLLKEQIAPATRLEQIKLAYDRAESLLKVKRRQKEELQKDLNEILGHMDLLKAESRTAPFEAVVWAVFVRSNEFQAAASPLLELIDKREVWINAYFSEQHAAQLTLGKQVSVEVISTGKTTTGHIRFVRAGVGRTAISSPVQSPPESLKDRIVAARVEFDPTQVFTSEEFLGVGRTVRVSIER
jgi:multidrug resistance efflux pump